MPKKQSTTHAALLSLGLLLGSCQSLPTGADAASLVATLPGTAWRLVSFNDQPAPALMTVNFGRLGEVSGLVLCNSFGGQVEIRDSAIIPGDITATALGCEFSGYAEEQASVRRLWAQPQVRGRMEGQMLILYEEGNRLRFARASGS